MLNRKAPMLFGFEGQVYPIRRRIERFGGRQAGISRRQLLLSFRYLL